MQSIGIPGRYAAKTFDDYKPQTQGQSMALVKARGFAAEWPHNQGDGIAFHGTVGTGKTHLAASILREAAERGASCLFVDIRQLLKTVQETFSAKDRTEAEVLRPILTVELAALDELGAARATDWTFDAIEHIINTRYNAGLSTIITTNLAIKPPGWTAAAAGATRYAAANAIAQETLGDRIGARMVSRIMEMCAVVEVAGDDYRATVRR